MTTYIAFRTKTWGALACRGRVAERLVNLSHGCHLGLFFRSVGRLLLPDERNLFGDSFDTIALPIVFKKPITVELRNDLVSFNATAGAASMVCRCATASDGLEGKHTHGHRTWWPREHPTN